jgi:uncharacterized integral membrane protein
VEQEAMNNGRLSRPEFPPQAVARSAGEVLHNAITLLELQWELLTTDTKLCATRFSNSALLLAGALAVLLGTVPVALAGLAYLLVTFTELPLWIALLLAALAGLLVGVLMGLAGWKHLRSALSSFDRSRDELARNLHFIKRTLADRPPASPRRT